MSDAVKDQAARDAAARVADYEHGWSADIEQEFSGPFKGRDFVHRYKYRKVINRFDIVL